MGRFGQPQWEVLPKRERAQAFVQEHEGARALVTNDSGPMHLAAALGHGAMSVSSAAVQLAKKIFGSRISIGLPSRTSYFTRVGLPVSGSMRRILIPPQKLPQSSQSSLKPQNSHQ